MSLHECGRALMLGVIGTAASVALFAQPELQPITLSVTMPNRIEDAPRLEATIALANSSTEVLDVAGLDAASLRFLITQTHDDGTGKCVVNSVGTPVFLSRSVSLSPGQAITAKANAFADYPLGLPPGRYTVQAHYRIPALSGSSRHGEILSRKMSLVVEERNTPEYRDFLQVCRELNRSRGLGSGMRQQSTSAFEHALSFGESHPDFDFTPLLVDLEIPHFGDIGRRAADFLIRTYPNTQFARRAQATKIFLLRVQDDETEGNAYMAWLKAEYAKPENADVARDMNHLQLGTIERPEDFAKYEAFLKAHSNSYFSAEARWLMATAVERGVVPPGMTKEVARKRFYGDLVQHDPASYRAKIALRNPEIAALVQGTQR